MSKPTESPTKPISNRLTTSAGNPVADNQNSLSAGSRQSAWRGVILFALGVTGLSSSEVWLLERVPNSTGADYVSLTSGLTLALDQGMRVTSTKSSMPDGLINATSEDENSASGSAHQHGEPGQQMTAVVGAACGTRGAPM
jgi:hypothetical protein